MTLDWEHPGMSPLFKRSPIHVTGGAGLRRAHCSIARTGFRANVFATLSGAVPETKLHFELDEGRAVTPDVWQQFEIELLAAQITAEATLLTVAGRPTAEVDEYASEANVVARIAARERQREQVTRANQYN